MNTPSSEKREGSVGWKITAIPSHTQTFSNKKPGLGGHRWELQWAILFNSSQEYVGMRKGVGG